MDAAAPKPPPLPPRAGRFRAPERRRWRPVMLAVLFAAAGFVAVLARVFGDDEAPTPLATAESFVRGLKLAENPPDGEPADAAIGYARAFDLLAATVRAQKPWEAFYQEWVLRTREHGLLLASDLIKKRGLGRDGRREIVFKLAFGDPRETVAEMAWFQLALSIDREDDRWVVLAYEIAPAEPGRRP